MWYWSQTCTRSIRAAHWLILIEIPINFNLSHLIFFIFLIFYLAICYSINRLDFVNNGKNQVVINLICCIAPSQLFTDIKPISLSSSANHDKQMHWMLPLKVMLQFWIFYWYSIKVYYDFYLGWAFSAKLQALSAKMTFLRLLLVGIRKSKTKQKLFTLAKINFAINIANNDLKHLFISGIAE